jgi:predicted dehydrogenase
MVITRREILGAAAVSGLAPLTGSPARSASPNGRVALACVGTNGRGESVLRDAAKNGDIVAICDVDEVNLALARSKYPRAQAFTDFRRMFDAIGKSVDAVTIATPDHAHAPIAAMAIHLGKHCYCEKPMAHSIWETRRLTELAREKRVVTQMGIQGTASSRFRRSVAQIQAGALGVVIEVHVWTDRPIWPQGIPRPRPAPAPSTLHWDLWLGPAPARPYAEGYHPMKWRGFWEFGSGALGDMGCHLMNLAYRALRLHSPVAATARCSPSGHETYPASSLITYEFAAAPNRPAVKIIWYDGGNRPPASLLPGVDLLENGALIVGTKGRMYVPGLHNERAVIYGGVAVGEPHYEESPGHFEEFMRAIRGGPPTAAGFVDYAGAFTEAVLVGNLAVWSAGTRIVWDSHAMRARNADLSAIIRPPYRPGWSI